MAVRRKYPVGIQDFKKLRASGFVYVDKTALIYKMISEEGSYFLSRPRRFGKSLLVSTLAAIFEGRRDLFEAFTTEDGIEQPRLYITQTDWRWEKYPVVRFDFSSGDLQSVEQLDELIDVTLSRHEEQYGITPSIKSPNIRMANLLRTMHEQSGRRVVVLVDEYDNFILHALGDSEKVAMARSRFQNVFSPLKAEDAHVKFVFITGISRFSQMGVFSKLNNLQNISMQPVFDTLCGISEEEMNTQLHPDIELLAQANGKTFDEQMAELKRMYDGYHFSHRLTDVYNPFSLVNVLKSHEVGAYWFDRGTSGALIRLLAQMPPVDTADIDNIKLPDTAFDLPLEDLKNPVAILFQSGYLTIRDSQKIGMVRMYTIGFPNAEVRMGFADCLFKHVASCQRSDLSKAVFQNAYNDFLLNDSLPQFIAAIQTFFASLPYQLEQGNKNERHYHALLYTLLVAFGADIRAEVSSAKGRADMTLLMPKGIYVIELKYDKTADEALEQIEQNGYAEQYKLDGRPITKVGIVFSSSERNITEWKAVAAD